jgi:hypothetical protein
MSKFNLEFRMKVVTEYFSGKGATSLAKEYGVSNTQLFSAGSISLSDGVLRG